MMQFTRERLCEAVHHLLDLLDTYSMPPTDAVPKDGIYFWSEAGEVRQGQTQRITRVGSHREPHRLCKRITLHYGADRDRSVFRRHVGAALMNRNGEPESEIQEWYKARGSAVFSHQRFQQYEHRVHREIQRGTYRGLRVDDAAERLALEKKLIALISRCDHCRPSPGWLGNHAYREEIRQSGLWNVRHVLSDNEFEAGDLARLERLVSATLAASLS